MNKIVIITGASRGLGLALANDFAAHDWHVIGTGRSAQPSEYPTQADYWQFDAGTANECQSFWEQLHRAYPDARVCLINNAGGWVDGGLLDTKPEDYEQQMRSSYFAAVYMTQNLAKVISGARIVNVISDIALQVRKNIAAAGAAKAATMYFFQSLQKEFKSEQYQITNLYPSDIATHGPNPSAIDPNDLAIFIRGLVEDERSYYLRDVTMYPRGNRW